MVHFDGLHQSDAQSGPSGASLAVRRSTAGLEKPAGTGNAVLFPPASVESTPARET